MQSLSFNCQDTAANSISFSIQSGALACRLDYIDTFNKAGHSDTTLDAEGGRRLLRLLNSKSMRGLLIDSNEYPLNCAGPAQSNIRTFEFDIYVESMSWRPVVTISMSDGQRLAGLIEDFLGTKKRMRHPRRPGQTKGPVFGL